MMTQDQLHTKVEVIEKTARNLSFWQKVIFFITIASIVGSAFGSAIWKYAKRDAKSEKDNYEIKNSVKQGFDAMRNSDSLHWLRVESQLEKKHYIDSMHIDAKFQVIQEQMKHFKPIQVEYATQHKDPTTGAITFQPVN